MNITEFRKLCNKIDHFADLTPAMRLEMMMRMAIEELEYEDIPEAVDTLKEHRTQLCPEITQIDTSETQILGGVGVTHAGAGAGGATCSIKGCYFYDNGQCYVDDDCMCTVLEDTMIDGRAIP